MTEEPEFRIMDGMTSPEKVMKDFTDHFSASVQTWQQIRYSDLQAMEVRLQKMAENT